LFTSKGRLISGGSVERQFYLDVYISRARTAIRSLSPSCSVQLESYRFSSRHSVCWS